METYIFRIARSLKYLNGSLKPEDINFEKETGHLFIKNSKGHQF